jgi:hypothetical protein
LKLAILTRKEVDHGAAQSWVKKEGRQESSQKGCEEEVGQEAS